jgi:hypothetical protein
MIYMDDGQHYVIKNAKAGVQEQLAQLAKIMLLHVIVANYMHYLVLRFCTSTASREAPCLNMVCYEVDSSVDASHYSI